jgi:hypothetical protein
MSTNIDTESRRARISYCIPILNRLDDLKLTLFHNVDVMAQLSGAAELVIGNFDESDDCQNWVETNFRQALDAGLLRFERFQPLPYWHFSWAKNAFSDLISGDYYSSLDGDNFLTVDEAQKTLQIVSDTSRRFLIHHFSGQWGDGTSGRLTIPALIYRTRPYVDETFPRQFDELAVILRLLAADPDLIFVSREGVNIFELSKWCRDFLRLNNLSPKRRAIHFRYEQAPLNPRGENYVDDDEVLHHFQNLNASYTCWRFSMTRDARAVFEERMQDWQRRYVRTASCYSNLRYLFNGLPAAGLEPNDAVTLYAVNRNNLQYLEPWIRHYRLLGVERFVIVDDGSSPPLREALLGDDIFWLEPRFGAFRTSKVFWLRALMGAFQLPGSWVLTLDIDEFLDIEGGGKTGNSPLRDLIAMADRKSWSHFPGLLLDMMPRPGRVALDGANFVERMDWHYQRPANDDTGYQSLKPVKWAFGDRWPIAFSVDVRYRIFGTVDCLRKIPLLRFDIGVDLNQGFHTLYRHGEQLTLEELLPRKRGILPIRHYKLAKLFWTDEVGKGVLSRSEQYFDRTQKNLERIANADLDYVRRWWEATPFKTPYRGAHAFKYYLNP